MNLNLFKASLTIFVVGLFSCNKVGNQNDATHKNEIQASFSFHQNYLKEIEKLPKKSPHEKDTTMLFVKGGSFLMGGTSVQANPDELPVHKETVDDFYMDATEVTNAEFSAFVTATGYITTAERPIDPHFIAAITGVAPETVDTDPAALVFNGNPKMWWSMVKGANWRHPQGPKSTIIGKDSYPVVQVSWYDAIAYCHWANKRLPTEEEFEYAARNQGKQIKYSWGNDFNKAVEYANFHQGNFPLGNLKIDNFEGLAPVKSFKNNALGIYDIGGNVWEWTLNSYFSDAYSKKINFEQPILANDNTLNQKKVIRGGSFLCNESYCSGYRVAARMNASPDTGLEHLGFRCVRNSTK
ncbi:formylglycine-generating enzyme family protein [Aquimarina agarivorans]|uniref:formylglycine-generating enzyme family protein n=1 Tax=Aquimarina agarivorans TaxID=980584 RepID=UPI000248EFBC|nr:formylglycine-generating enzyme family protein [Aquimarina agarivorans]